MTIRVLTWNILYREADARLETLCARIREAAPDVVLLQESNRSHAEAVARELGMSVAVVAPEPVDSPSVPAIVTGLPVRETAAHSLISGAPRGTWAVSAQVDTPDGPVSLISTHLQHTSQAGRMALDPQYRAVAAGAPVDVIDEEQLRESVRRRLVELGIIDGLVKSLAVRMPVVLGGDLNCPPDGIEYRTVVGWGLNDSWRAGPRLGSGDTILERNPLISDVPGVYSDLAAKALPGLKADLDYTLDFLFHTRELHAGDAWVVGRPLPRESWASDHLGLVVDYSVEA